MRLAAALTGSLKAEMAAEVAAGQRATRWAMETAARGARSDLGGQTRRAGLGERLAKAWRVAVYPAQPSLSAAANVTSKAPRIVRAFDEGATIRSANGFWLAIPTESAPKRGVGGKRITPSNFPENRFGPLRFVYRKGKPSLLVVDAVRITASGRVGRQAKGGALTRTGKLKKGITTVVMFVLVPQVRLRKRLDIAAVERGWSARLPQMIVDRWELERGE